MLTFDLLMLASLSALTCITVLELLDQRADGGPSLGNGGKEKSNSPANSARDSASSSSSAHTIDMVLRGAIAEVQQATRTLEGETAVVESALADALGEYRVAQGTLTERIREYEVRRRAGVGERERNAAADALKQEQADNLRSGYLQKFESLAALEKLIATRLSVERTVSHPEKRAWRQRLVGQVVELEKSVGDESKCREKIEELEQKFQTVLSLWGESFRGGNDSNQRITGSKEVSVDSIGFEPIYRPMFASDAEVHPSDAEGRRLHEIYNMQKHAS